MDGGARKTVFSTFPRAGSRQQVSAQKRAEVLMCGEIQSSRVTEVRGTREDLLFIYRHFSHGHSLPSQAPGSIICTLLSSVV